MSGEQKIRHSDPSFDVQTHESSEGENKWSEIMNFICEYFDLEKKREDLMNYIQDNPMKSVFIFVTLVMCSIPVVFFIMFVVGSIVFTLIGFIIFEGSILAFGTFVLISVILVVGTFGAGVSILLIVGYKGLQMSNGVCGQARNILMNVPFVRNILSHGDNKAH